MRAIALCAFRQPWEDGVVEATYIGQEIDVPDALAERLAAEGHIALLAVAAVAAPRPSRAVRSRR